MRIRASALKAAEWVISYAEGSFAIRIYRIFRLGSDVLDRGSRRDRKNEFIVRERGIESFDLRYSVLLFVLTDAQPARGGEIDPLGRPP